MKTTNKEIKEVKDELYYVLINVGTAKRMIGFSTLELCQYLGISTNTFRRWEKRIYKPSALNMYKMHWFIYLVLHLKTPIDILKNAYRISDMSLTDNPTGQHTHLEPWNGDPFIPITRMQTSFLNGSKDCRLSSPPMKDTDRSLPQPEAIHDVADDFHTKHKKEPTGEDMDNDWDDMNETDTWDDTKTVSPFSICVKETSANTKASPMDAVNDLLSQHTKEEIMQGCVFNIYSTFKNAFHLSGSIQNENQKIQTLLAACNDFLEDNSILLDMYEQQAKDRYLSVHDTESFQAFLKEIALIQATDERFHPAHLDVYFYPLFENEHASFPVTPAKKFVVTKKDMKVILDNACVFVIPFDCSFKIGSFASGNNLTYEFFILSKNIPFKLVMDFNVWDE